MGLKKVQKQGRDENTAATSKKEIMDQLTSDLQGVAVYMDDLLVSGANAKEHLQTLESLIQRIQDKGLRCNL